MNCQYCGNEYSDSVLEHHEARCQEQPEVRDEDLNPDPDAELEALHTQAEALGIKSYKQMKKETLVAKIAEHTQE
jgi:hypothetical protein